MAEDKKEEKKKNGKNNIKSDTNSEKNMPVIVTARRTAPFFFVSYFFRPIFFIPLHPLQFYRPTIPQSLKRKGQGVRHVLPSKLFDCMFYVHI